MKDAMNRLRKHSGLSVAAFFYVIFSAFPAYAVEAAAKGEVGGPPTVLQAIFVVLNFAVLVWLIVKYGGPPIQEHFKNRRASVADAIEESEALRAEAKAKLEEYSARLDAFDKEKKQLLEEFFEIGEREKARLIAEGREKAERIRENARAQAAREARNARLGLESEFVDRAVDMAAEEIERRLNPLVEDRLIDRSIDSFKSLKQ